MIGLGTIINVGAIVLAGILGMFVGKFIEERVQETLMIGNGIAVLFIGMAGALSQMFTINNGKVDTQGTMLLIASLAIGAIVGELLNIEKHLEDFGEWLKLKTGNSKDGGFVNAFVTASLTVCVGAMAIVGALQDGMMGDTSTLVAKAILDFIIILVMTSSLGKGCMFSAIPVGLFQGLVTLLAVFIKPFMTTLALANISFVGSVLIFCVGLNLVFGKTVRVANLLPGLIVAVIWSFLPL